MMEERQSSFVADAGLLGLLAVLVGGAVLVWGLAIAISAGRRRHALAVFAAAWLPIPLAFLGKALGDHAALHEIVQLGPAVTPKDLAAGLQQGSAVTACATLGVLLGLSGAVAALARSREDGAEETQERHGPGG